VARAGVVPEQMDPASLLKPLLVEAALAQGAITEDEVLDCGAGEQLTAAQTIVKSSNPCAARIAAKMGATSWQGACVRPEALLAQYVKLAAGGSSLVRHALRDAVLEGTGRRAASALIATAGKTATSLGTSAECPTGERVASFIGFAPAEAPTRVVLAAVVEPKADLPLGGRFAAPLFREVVEARSR
jgi:cell division protein FtsI/penicillin-binding protein 2